jgi:hypothetical protein
MMMDLANNDLPDIMFRAFFILIILSITFYQYVSITAINRHGLGMPNISDSINNSHSCWND